MIPFLEGGEDDAGMRDSGGNVKKDLLRLALNIPRMESVKSLVA